MSSLLVRGGMLYAKIKDVAGRWRRLATGHADTEEGRMLALAWVRERERKVATARKAGATGPLTVNVYAASWLDKRTNATANDDRTRIEKHVLPRIGDMLLADVRPRHIRDLILEIKAEGALAPRTIRKVSGVLHTLFKSALIDELITANPVEYERGILPKNVDKDPSWRRQAIYTRPEIEQILSDELIPVDRRVLYALKFFTGRHSEVAALTWGQYDAAAKPLGALALDETKTDIPRLIPVHPTLAKILATWKLSHWEDLYGHAPQPTDLIVPTRNLTRRDANEAQRQLVYDLEKIGLRVKAGKSRNRRGHDMRRTLISLARTDGALDAVLKVITHGPTTQQMIDLYSSFPWETLCAEFGKLKISLREGQVVAMAANGSRGPGLVQSRTTGARGGSDRFKERPRRDSKERIVSLADARRVDSRRRPGAHVSGFAEVMDQIGPNRVIARCDAGLLIIAASALADTRATLHSESK